MIGGRLLTLDDVAAELQCSMSTVKRRVRSGLLPVVVDGRLRRVREDDLARYIVERVTLHREGTGAGADRGRTLPKGARLWD
jgi:excisionase family DNA binding protein